MEVAKNFGVEPLLLAAQIVNFLILMFLLKRFFYKPVLTVLKNREQTIKEGLKKAEEAAALLLKTKEDEKKILKAAQEQANKFIIHANEQSKQLMEEARAHAAAEAEKIIADASEQIQRETNEAEKRLRENIGIVATNILKKTLSGLVSNKTQQEIMAKAAKALKQKVN